MTRVTFTALASETFLGLKRASEGSVVVEKITISVNAGFLHMS